MFKHFSCRLAFTGLFLALIAVGCSSATSAPALTLITPATSSTAIAQASNESTASFTFSGGLDASYTLQTSIPTSQLRHDHREFTIILSHAGISLFIVFYGYQGPGNYTLADSVNGGDIHVGLQNDTISWDLLMQPGAHCNLKIASDLSTSNAGLDRMQGSFSCPLLFSSTPAHPQKPITINNGSFNIAMLITS